MQKLNRWLYEIGISRIQTKFSLPVEDWFFTHDGMASTDRVYRFSTRSGRALILKKQDLFDFELCKTVQAGDDLYCFEAENALWWRYGNISTKVTKELKSSLLDNQEPLSLVYLSACIYAIGVRESEDDCPLALCFKYQIEQDVWHEIAELNQVRQ